MNKAFGRIENISDYSQVQVFTNPLNAVNILGYTLNDDGSLAADGGITLSPQAAKVVLNMLKEWEQYAVENELLEVE